MPIYQDICGALSIDPRDDFLSSIRLSRLIGNRWEEVPGHLRNRKAEIFGPSEYLARSIDGDTVKIVADSGITEFLSLYGHVPDIIVTDLDGDTREIMECYTEGTFLFVHSHGDNMQIIERFSASMDGNFQGTTQNVPLHNVRNYFGFTDGDRAAYIAMELGSASIRLHGFDFSVPVAKPGKSSERKLKKLEIAQRLISLLDRDMKESGLPGISSGKDDVRF